MLLSPRALGAGGVGREEGLQDAEDRQRGWGPHLIHMQLHLVPHPEALQGRHLMQDEASTDLGPGHWEEHVLGKGRAEALSAYRLSLPWLLLAQENWGNCVCMCVCVCGRCWVGVVVSGGSPAGPPAPGSLGRKPGLPVQRRSWFCPRGGHSAGRPPRRPQLFHLLYTAGAPGPHRCRTLPGPRLLISARQGLGPVPPLKPVCRGRGALPAGTHSDPWRLPRGRHRPDGCSVLPITVRQVGGHPPQPRLSP